ncbi:hypothetical protein [Natronorubrum sp. DTA7]|uniref:hypothetical protein n=1 Tax=Natronorubrum sp. DTA7 TaxID=3447016 RepID=UPI003F856161
MTTLSRRRFLATSGAIPFLGLAMPTVVSAQQSATGQDLSTLHGEYRGTASVTIGYYGTVAETCTTDDWGFELCLPDEFGITHRNTVRKNVSLVISESLRGEATTEDNPFSVAIATLGEHTDTPPATEGDFNFVSALEVLDPELGPPPVLLQYWNLAIDGSAITGELTNRHTNVGAGYNVLWAYDQFVQMDTPHWPVEGTTLEGLADGDSIRLRIDSRSPDQANEYVIELEAERV